MISGSTIDIIRGPFRICNITKISDNAEGFVTLPVCEGLSIEYNCNHFNPDKEPNYIVLTFIYYDADEGAYLSPVGIRCIDYVDANDYPIFRDLVRLGISLVNVQSTDI